LSFDLKGGSQEDKFVMIEPIKDKGASYKVSVKTQATPKPHLTTAEYLEKLCLKEGTNTMTGPFNLKVCEKFGRVGLLTIN
jgi:hypothetical protein